MNAILKALGLLADALSAWLRTQRAAEIQEAHDANHNDPQSAFADRFGAAAGGMRHDSGELPTTKTATDVDAGR